MKRASDVANFLAELDANLEGGGRHRREIVDELTAHFADLVDAETRGVPTVSEAVRRFGHPRAIAAEFNAIRQSRVRRRIRMVAVVSCCLAVVGAPSLLTTSGRPQQKTYSLTSKHPAIVSGAIIVDPMSGRVLARIYGRRG